MEQVIAANYAACLDKCVEQLGVPNFLKTIGFDLTRLQDPAAFVTASEFTRIVEKAISMTNCSYLGLKFGQHLSIVNHGYLGYAAMSSPTMGNALNTMLNYINTRTNLISLDSELSGDKVCIGVHVLMENQVLSRFIVEMVIVHLINMRQFLISATDSCVKIDLNYAPPSYASYYQDILKTEIQFNCLHNQVWLWKKELDYPISFADDTSYQLAKSQLQKIATRLAQQADWASKIKTILLSHDLYQLSMDEVASQLCVSARTLRRHLQKESITYQEIVDEVRKQKAYAYLLNQQISMSEISFLLGFHDTSNFSKAFKRWTGLTPTEYRDSHSSK
ncbi:AraC family transcriptional regulator [Legionella sp. W05-934-2]|jgi:AraC-like DNA-binding protein|uniref:AraC family transcriptional regulator n=1 Tax=Legionella sp. W05-934-2 TaxID=1198649 RepID=UPI003461EDE0